MTNDIVGVEKTPMYIFGRNTNNTLYNPFIGKIYKFKIYENNQLVKKLIPCYRKTDGKIGLYDEINQVFYFNEGTGKFTKGNYV